MKTTVGLWIDHRKAVIVAVTDKREEIKLIISRVEKQLGRPAGIRSTTPYEPHQVRQMIAARKSLRDISTFTRLRQDAPCGSTGRIGLRQRLRPDRDGDRRPRRLVSPKL